MTGQKFRGQIFLIFLLISHRQRVWTLLRESPKNQNRCITGRKKLYSSWIETHLINKIFKTRQFGNGSTRVCDERSPPRPRPLIIRILHQYPYTPTLPRFLSSLSNPPVYKSVFLRLQQSLLWSSSTPFLLTLGPRCP